MLSIRTTIPFIDYPKTAKKAYERIMEYAEINDLSFSGGLFVCYHNTDLDNIDVEMGFPVAKTVSGNNDISGYSIPAQKSVSGIFLGTYEDTDLLIFVN